MKRIMFIFTFFISSLISSFAFAQQQEGYAFIDVDYWPQKLVVTVIKEGTAVKREIGRPKDAGGSRIEITKFMNDLNSEGYQLLSVTPYLFNYGANGSSLSESYVFVKKK